MTWHDAPMLGLDLETTGPDPYEAVPVSFALVMFFEPGVAERVRTGLVQPGLPIPPEATAVHGITDEAVAERGGDLFRFTEGVLGYLLDATRDGVPLVGMNLRYDLTVMDQLTRRFMKHGLVELGFETPVLDALVLDRHVDRYRKGRRTLGALADHYGLAPRPEHDPVADVFAARWVVGRIADRNPELRTLDITEVHTSSRRRTTSGPRVTTPTGSSTARSRSAPPSTGGPWPNSTRRLGHRPLLSLATSSSSASARRRVSR